MSVDGNGNFMSGIEIRRKMFVDQLISSTRRIVLLFSHEEKKKKKKVLSFQKIIILKYEKIH